MLVIRFGKWNHKATSMFIYTRIYRSGYRWTPFCIKEFRYVGDLRDKPVMADTNNPTITFTNKQNNESFDVKAIKYTPDKDGWCAGAHVKERDEPIKPTLNENHSYVSDAFKCGKCGHAIRFYAKYCEDCGQAVKWDAD